MSGRASMRTNTLVETSVPAPPGLLTMPPSHLPPRRGVRAIRGGMHGVTSLGSVCASGKCSSP